MTRGVADDPTGSLQTTAAETDEPPVPDRLGPYRVRGRLGHGGMGIVYRGHDETLDRPVALKVLARTRGDALADLEREARAVAAVTHPNVVQVYAAGEQDGLSFFAMELVGGPDLREVLEREGPLAPDRARRYFAQAARGLRAAAKKGILHRDVKPANLLLCPREDQVKVADFGLAKRACVDASLGGTSLIAGTPLYVAPEVIRDGEGDVRADIYSLGAAFHHLLAGEPPFGGSPAQALVGHVHAPPPELRQVRPDLPDDLASVVARCLSKDPAARFRDYDELLVALEPGAVASGRAPVPAQVALPAPPPSPRVTVVPRPPERRSFGAVVLLIATVALVVHFAGTVAGVAQPRTSRRRSSATRRTSATPRATTTRCEFAALVHAIPGAQVPADLLSPKTVEAARAASFGSLPYRSACRASGCRFAVCGTNSPVLAWHVHDARGRTVVVAARDGTTAELGLLDFLRFLRSTADRRGVSWQHVVTSLMAFLPADAARRELSQLDEETGEH